MNHVPQILIDWNNISSEDSFYSIILPQMGAPNWHGRNLDSINDSLVTGGICSYGPPFEFIYKNTQKISKNMIEFSQKIEEIIADSISENGGKKNKNIRVTNHFSLRLIMRCALHSG